MPTMVTIAAGRKRCADLIFAFLVVLVVPGLAWTQTSKPKAASEKKKTTTEKKKAAPAKREVSKQAKAPAKRAAPVARSKPPEKRVAAAKGKDPTTPRSAPPRRANDAPMNLGDEDPPPAKRRKRSGTRRRKLPDSNALSIPRVDVIGRRPSELDSVPGSANVVGRRTLRSNMPITAGEALRKIPGVHVSDEDGMGLRLNIGIRGLDPVRSRKILVLEDGVPVAMAPYGEPEMYYTPRIERMQRLELVKGSGAILWGPQTIGGVLNMITRDPPKQLQLRAEARYGSYNYFLAHASVGNTVNNFGYLFEVLHLRYDGFRKLNLALTDISGKMVIRISKRSILGVKLHFHDQFSHATYLGLTTPQYINNPSQNHAENDRFPIRRYGLSLQHKYLLGNAGFFHTTLYAHYLTRFWQRQDFVRAGGGSDYERIINGQNQIVPNASDAPNDGSSIFFRNSTGNRNRAFTVAGLESRYTLEYRFGPVENELIVGLRFHYERGDERYIIGDRKDDSSGTIRDDENRTTWAMAAYLQNSFMFFNRKLKIVPGFRFEMLFPYRHLVRTRVLQKDGSRKIGYSGERENSQMFAPIPGIGISYEIVKGFNIFAGVHRGFAPPRTKDSITADGEDLELDPEFSWNYELGLRLRRKNYLLAQVAGFVMDFQNQVIPPSESSGAVATDPNNQGKSVINAGQTLHAGLEASATFDLPALLEGGFNLPLTVSYTWVPAAFFVGGQFDGNRLPYAPEHMLTVNLRFFHRLGFSASFSANYVSAHYTDKGNTITPSVNGLVGQIDGRFLLNARLGYTFRRGRYSIGAFIAGKNLTNANYISNRRPQGIQPGEPFQLIGGIQGTL